MFMQEAQESRECITGRSPPEFGTEDFTARDHGCENVYAAISATKNVPRWIKQLQAIGKWPASSTPAASCAAH